MLNTESMRTDLLAAGRFRECLNEHSKKAKAAIEKSPLGKGGPELLDRVEANAQAGFFPIDGAFVKDAFFRRFIERGGHGFESGGGIVFFAGRHQREILLLERVQTGFDAAVSSILAGATAHAAFGGLRIRHKFV